MRNLTSTTHRTLGAATCAAALLASAAHAGSVIVTVTTLNDVSDVATPNQISDLPGPDGRVSFREALALVNTMPGPQTIHFNIPASEFWLMMDRALLRNESNAFTLSDDGTTVDFTTQTAFTGDTNPTGNEVGIYGTHPSYLAVAGIYISGDNCTIIGLDRVMQRGYGVNISGNNNRVIGCTIGGPLYAGVKVQGFPPVPATSNIVGGTAPGQGNVLSSGNSGVRVDGPTQGTIVIGNTLIGSRFAGVEVRGAYCCPDYTPFDTRIGGPTPEEANWIADNGQYGEEGFPEGDQVRVEWAVDTVVEGNIIGTTQTGDARYPGAHGTVGIGVRESDNTIIRNNLVSGIRKEGVNHYAGQIFGVGISIYGPNTGVIIEGNRVGTDASGLNFVPNRSGIAFGWFQGYPAGGQIGGAAPEQANLVAFNELTGIAISSGTNGVTIERNSIHSNGLLGIDLLGPTGGSGVTPNDPGDFDTGANGLQNFPVLEAAQSAGGFTTIDGTLNSAASTQFRIEFFASAPGSCDSSGHGEGATFLGATDVTTNASGNATFSESLPVSVDAGSVLTATATKTATGDTSEFAACIAVDATSNPVDLNGDGVVNGLDLGILLANWSIPAGSPGCASALPCASDLNGDGGVDGIDLGTLLANWTI